MTGGVQRRRVLAATVGAAAALTACAPDSRGTPKHAETRNVRDYGAIGDGDADDTEAIAAACRTGGGPLVLYLPAGAYRVTSWPDMPDFTEVYGDGADVTTIGCENDITLISLRGKQRVRFARLGIYVTGPKATAVSLSQSFRCSFDAVLIRGNHTSDNFPAYLEQRGVVLEQNTGGTAFINCDINNFGYGLVTSCIQNYVTSSKFTSNRIGVFGTGNDHNAGLALTNVEFVSDNDPRTTDKHVLVDGAANDWWLTNVWFEGSDTALSIGHREHGGPAQFGMVNCKVAARSICLDLIYCRQPYLANVRFDPDIERHPIEVRVDHATCPEGTAVNLISSAGAEIDPAVFPRGWQVSGRGRMYGPTYTGTMVAEAGPGDADLFRAQAPDGSGMAAVLSSGAWLSDRAEAGVVLKDTEGGYWRLSVSTTGAVTSTALGRQRPNR